MSLVSCGSLHALSRTNCVGRCFVWKTRCGRWVGRMETPAPPTLRTRTVLIAALAADVATLPGRTEMDTDVGDAFGGAGCGAGFAEGFERLFAGGLEAMLAEYGCCRGCGFGGARSGLLRVLGAMGDQE